MDVNNVFGVAINIVINFMIDIINEDDEEAAVLEKNENFAEVTVYNFNDRQFKEHFRLLPETFEILLLKLHDSTLIIHEIKSGHPEVDIEKQLLITLWCLANVESFRSVADRFGISKSCCWRVLYRTCSRILNVQRHYQIIAFPAREKALGIINQFETINGFPGIVGIIDGCHIRIEKPKDYPNSYINRKGFPSILLQGICDHRKLFLDVYAGEAGSIHDARLFRRSSIFSRMRLNQVEFPNDSHLIGDLAYPLSRKLIVGFRNNGQLTDPQKNFNKKLSQVRVLIENTFGLLKCRFRRLKMIETKRLDLISLLIVSACILHNICIMNNDFIENVDQDHDENNGDIFAGDEDGEGVIKRNDIMNYLNGIN